MLKRFLIYEIEQHLRSRGIDLEKTNTILDKETRTAVFLLYNLSGQLIGYQRYNPKGIKGKEASKVVPILRRYYTYVTRADNRNVAIAVWGLDTYNKLDKYLFITEGIFDANKIHNAGYPAIAILNATGDKRLRTWLRMLPQAIISISDNDPAGKMIKKLSDRMYVTPNPYKDLGEMPQNEVNSFLKQIVQNIETNPINKVKLITEE
ncbi:hypothetical protein CMI47_12990 [Candidatus Pacearchaeota archaeon]|nr:hypothetical protein [Candidatus Pacearchaeota archaeon]|tara:strand:+ start:32491 stop:33111 length:621 start_codon:yes stop_codon:yes gene_type:complete